MTRLADLNAKLDGTVEQGVLRFDCPRGEACPFSRPGWVHPVRVHIHGAPSTKIGDVKYWQASGSFPDSLTLAPSVNEYTVKCDGEGKPLEPEQIDVQGWHGWVQQGDAR